MAQSRDPPQRPPREEEAPRPSRGEQAETRALADETPPTTEHPRAAHHTTFEPDALVAGRYRIVRYIARGGMGEVYEAEDLELHEHVALKTIRPSLAADERAIERFKREIQLSRKVTHPSVCRTLELGHHHEAGEADVWFLTMELLCGETLAERIEREGPLEPSEALPLLRQMAEALEAAHRAGIVHRDFKSKNVMLVMAEGEEEGRRAVVTDFGLARTHSVDLSGGESLTVTGAVMGTPDYMAPEQLQGQTSPASDIYSLGVVLYEMVTGVLPFGPDAGLEGAIKRLDETPASPRRHTPDLDARWEAVILRCLAVDPLDRFECASDVLRALEGEPVAPAWKTRRRRLLLAGCALLIPLLAAAGYLALRPEQRGPLTRRRLTTNPPENRVEFGVALSPDGQHYAYSDKTSLFLRHVDTGEKRALPRPEGMVIWGSLSWFPDASKLLACGYDKPGSPAAVWTVSTLTGEWRKLRDRVEGALVSPDGERIAFVDGVEWSLWLMDADGRNAHEILDAAGEGLYLGGGTWSPDGRRLALQTSPVTGGKLSQIETRDRDGGDRRIVLSDSALYLPGIADATWLVWLEDGRIVFAKADPLPHQFAANIWAIHVDPDTGQGRGEPRRLTDWDGMVASSLSASNDGKRLIFLGWTQQWDIYVAELEPEGLGTPRRLTLDDSLDFLGGWMPDSSAVLFSSNRNGTFDVFVQDLENGDAKLLVGGPGTKSRPQASPDGSSILYLEVSGESRRFMRYPLAGGALRQVLEAGKTAWFRCARHGPVCVAGERGKGQLHLSVFDPRHGVPRQLTSIDMDLERVNFDVSPDGTRVAVVDGFGHIRIVGAEDGVKIADLEALPTEAPMPVALAWAADGQALYVTRVDGKSAWLLQVDLNGSIRTLLEREGMPIMTAVAASPDGRYLAIEYSGSDNDVWLIENP